ncbi:heterokaryon incompatibility protein-domain-containing protein [Neurospora hispaniola]|uniref:Heterokaryon incompatibility protein-domain-containing protein n=1 Tax=Neurospora hispaniola TaxID=588809 RepID=A0AAJ0MPX6_9PEZI|nr:heterokaryon incompatibility protein-domain-containing protein [Neurospora hispaniola]
MSTEPTPPEDESSGDSNTQTIFVSSNDKAVTKLCGICSKIPAWFWTRELENDEEISVELQPFKEMQTEAQNGCGLCQLLCSEEYYNEWGYVLTNTLLELGTGKLVKNRKRGFIPIPSPWRPCSPAAADEKSDLILIQDWIANCQLHHTNCSNVTKDFLPTRLLDVEAFSNGRSPKLEDDIKLVRSASGQIPKEGPAPQYITLSHCWGPPERRPITTTQANLPVRMERISFAALPRTFQDAVVLTRKLEQRYLWIDSLCIIQDDENDWAQEASTMADVYTQSYCTLAALSSGDSTAGLRKKTQTNPDMLIDISANDGHNEPFNGRLVSNPNIWDSEYDGWWVSEPTGTKYRPNNPLRYRAWALQEKELSTRVVHFGFRQLLWECGELEATAQLPWYHAVRKRTRRRPQGSILSKPLSYRMTARWLNICEDYSSRSLTKETDKLVALSGIARSYQKYFPNDKYMAGLWSSHLPLALLWERTGFPKDRYTTEYIAPSWSWTHPATNISFERINLQILTRKMGRNKPDKWLDELEVVGFKGQPKHGDEYGALEEGVALELKGALLFEADAGQVDTWASIHLYKNGVKVGYCEPDTVSGLVEAQLNGAR